MGVLGPRRFVNRSRDSDQKANPGHGESGAVTKIANGYPWNRGYPRDSKGSTNR